ncbi:hypothetical protein D3OALGA1CA_1071 [Olavius algarvensis associated proteobacterium Delta 3]|nr:hypothetical protein D3OALGA1CA_1071 [Olavius algarvensis associated proteobacterium Delta 3]
MSDTGMIFSPIARGGGAFVVHRMLSEQIPGYQLSGYHPWLALAPGNLFPESNATGVRMLHTTPESAPLFRRKGIPSVITFHNYVLDRYMANYSSVPQQVYYQCFLLPWTRMALKQATAVTAVSHFLAGLIRREIGFEGQIPVIYNGIDTQRFKPAPGRSSRRKTCRILFSGNLIRRKGAQWLFDIARKIPSNACIYYTGGLRTRHRLPSHPALRPLGAVSYGEMPAVYRRMDLLLMPTVREGFGLAVAEAMASALPVVASNCSSIPELVDSGKGGFLCPVGDVAGFVETITRLVGDPGLRRSMGAYNRKKAVRLFSMETTVHAYRRLFANLMHRTPRA